MRGIKCIFVEKKDGFNIEANSLLEDFKNNLRIKNLYIQYLLKRQ